MSVLNRKWVSTKNEPQTGSWLIRHLFPDKGADTISGDLAEYFQETLEQGVVRARLLYWLQFVIVIGTSVYGWMKWRMNMLRKVIVTALRNMRRQWTNTLIHIVGLGMGIASCLLVYLYVHTHLSYDNYHRDLERLYRVASHDVTPQGEGDGIRISGPEARIMREEFPEIEAVAQLLPIAEPVIVRVNDKSFYEKNRMFSDNEIFQILTIPFIDGDPATALSRPFTMVITKKMADRYFGDETAVGKTMRLNATNYEVTGVVENPPLNSHFNFDWLTSMKTLEGRYPFHLWFLGNLYTYIKVTPNVDMVHLSARIREIARERQGEQLKAAGQDLTYFLQPVKDIHLISHTDTELTPSLKPIYLTVMSCVGVIILLIACFNFINLSTAQAIKRAKEVGVRKVIGAGRLELAVHCWIETGLLTLFALFAGFLTAGLLLPLFNQVAGLKFTQSEFYDVRILLVALILGIITSLVAGIYPAIIIAGYPPVQSLKLKVGSIRGKKLRTVLIICQFAASIALMTSTMLIHGQVRFMQNASLGMRIEQNLVLPVNGHLSLEENYDAVKSELLKNPQIQRACVSSEVPGQRTSRWDSEIPGLTVGLRVLDFIYVDSDYLNLFEISLVAGRNFLQDSQADIQDTCFIINESAVRELGLSSPQDALGKRLSSIFEGPIVGVVQDFHYRGLQKNIEPMAMLFYPVRFQNIIINLKPEDLESTLGYIRDVWKRFYPEAPFDYYFLDDSFNMQYRSEKNLGTLFSAFTMLGFLVSALGLLGLANLTTEQKTKEISIRKVLGATTLQMAWNLCGKFASLVLLANIIAWPLTFFVLSRWLDEFAFRQNIRPWPFLISTGLALLIALISVGVQAFKAASKDPVRTLRYE